MKVSVIGSAGRSSASEEQFSPKLFFKAADAVNDICILCGAPELVSGGAAGADHLAVSLHKTQGYPLTLHLPCTWDELNCQFLDTKVNDWRVNPGKVANFFHRKFSLSMERPENRSLESLGALIGGGTIKVHTYEGFHARNAAVAESAVVIACTWGPTQPPPGGTSHCWALASSRERHHIYLGGL